MENQDFKLKPSKHYLMLLLAILIISLNILVLLPTLFWIKVVGFILLFAYGFSILWQYVLLRNRNSIIAIKKQSDGQWLVQTNSNRYETELCGDSTVTGLVSILRFHTPKSFWRKTAVIFRDSLGNEQYRRLLVVLKK